MRPHAALRAILGAMLALSLSACAHAAASADSSDTFPAVVGDGYSVPDDSIPDLPPPPPEHAVQHKTKRRAKREAKSQARLPAPKLVQPHWAYDTVPPNQVTPLKKRLDLVGEMIKKYGRAYDYRAYTTEELEEKLQELENHKSAGGSDTPGVNRVH